METEIVRVGQNYIVEQETYEHNLRPGESTAITIEKVNTWSDHYSWFRFFLKIAWHLLWHERVKFSIVQQPTKRA